MQDSIIWELSSLVAFCKIIVNMHLVYACAKITEWIKYAFTIYKDTGNFVCFICCLNLVHASIIPSPDSFLSDLLAVWQAASNKKTNQEELDEQQLQFLGIVHYHVK